MASIIVCIGSETRKGLIKSNWIMWGQKQCLVNMKDREW